MVVLEGFRRALKETGLDLHMGEEELLKGQDPLRIVSRKTPVGGPSPEAVKSQIREMEDTLRGSRTWCEEGLKRIENSKNEIKMIEESLGLKGKT
jgi:hypothetical protein